MVRVRELPSGPRQQRQRTEHAVLHHHPRPQAEGDDEHDSARRLLRHGVREQDHEHRYERERDGHPVEVVLRGLHVQHVEGEALQVVVRLQHVAVQIDEVDHTHVPEG